MPDVDYGPGYDPSQADYISAGDQSIGALIALSAFAMVATIPLFTTEAAIEGPAALRTLEVVFEVEEGGVMVSETVTFAINATTVLTEGQQIIIAVIETGGFATEPAAVTAILTSWGFHLLTLDGLLALAAYDVNVANPDVYGNFGGWLGRFGPGGGGPGSPGGFSEPPGFPGFPATFSSGTGHYACITVFDEEECHWMY